MRLALANVVLAAFMAGVIWLVQLVVYPMFLDAGPSAFPHWDVEHSRRITPVVGVAIVGQVCVAAALLARERTRLVVANAALLALALGVTAFLSVPAHEELSSGFDAGTIDELVQTNWLRTFAWSAQVLVACGLLLEGARVLDRDERLVAQ